MYIESFINFITQYILNNNIFYIFYIFKNLPSGPLIQK
jgi:hypothetical protein